MCKSQPIISDIECIQHMLSDVFYIINIYIMGVKQFKMFHLITHINSYWH